MSITLSPLALSAQLHLDMSVPSPAAARVAVTGEVDLATADALRDRLLAVLQEHGPALLGVDLAGVTFMDCTGIGALVAVRNIAFRTGCQVRITRPQPMVRRILEVTGLLGVFTAPVVQPQPPPTRSELPSRIGPARVPVSQLTEAVAAAA